MTNDNQSSFSNAEAKAVEETVSTLKLTPDDIQQAAAQTGLLEEDRRTLVLRPEERRELPRTGTLYGYDPGLAHQYIPLPRNPMAQRPSLPTWRIELHGLRSSTPPIGIQLIGDVILGLDRGDGCGPDLDLSECNGHMHGISRRHAMIRPSQNRLYLVDLDSTNGTMYNAMPLIPGHAPELRSGDIITLGSLSFTLRIVEGPR